MLGIHTSLPADITGVAKDATTWFFLLTLVVLVPILEIAGIVLGIWSLFRAGDRKVLGIFGAILNAFLLVGGVMFGIILTAYIGHPF